MPDSPTTAEAIKVFDVYFCRKLLPGRTYGGELYFVAVQLDAAWAPIGGVPSDAIDSPVRVTAWSEEEALAPFRARYADIQERIRRVLG